MIDPRVEDIGKDVVLNYGDRKKGVITSFNKKFVFVKLKTKPQPQAFDRKFLVWNRPNQKINTYYSMF